MKFSTSILLISAALAVTSAAPLVNLNNINANVATNGLAKRSCADCTHADGAALDIIIKASADHYADIAHARLDGLMNEINTAKVTSGTQDLPKEKALLTITIQNKIDEAKKACSSQELEPVIKASVTADANLDIPWSKKEEVEKKMAELDLKITKLIAPAPAPVELDTPAPAPPAPAPATEAPAPVPETPAPVPETPAPAAETPAPASEALAPTPEVPAPASVETPAPAALAESAPQPTHENNNNNGELRVGIDVASNVDPKFVCKDGCKDSNDANTILNLRVTLEKELTPRLEHFYAEEVPTACTEKRASLLGGLLNLLSNARLSVQANVDAKAL
ncbi:hypothetical protein CPC16_002309 [Podila verticillata]|nr:hypothetical protein CPC16_002309 [Podila verticillata]